MIRHFKQWEASVILSCPPPGSGVHSWTYNLLRVLARRYSSDQDLFAAARSICDAHGTRVVPDREILDQIANARRGVCSRNERARSCVHVGRPNVWPSVDVGSIDKIVRGGATLETLRSLSPVKLDTRPLSAADAIDVLFPGDPLLCCGHSCKTATTRRKSAWRNIGQFQFLVPSPMTNMSGLNMQGRRSARCLDNTGPRRFLVVEFDFKPDVADCEASIAKCTATGTSVSAQHLNDLDKARLVAGLIADGVTVLDMCAALIVDLSKFVKPALVVHSGGKSLHSWYYCEGAEETRLRLFMEHTVSLGSDPATWTRCQLVRMPGGQRDSGPAQNVPQRIQYFDPGALAV
jgi:hypothetical protein